MKTVTDAGMVRRVLQGAPCRALVSRTPGGAPMLRLVFTDMDFARERYRQVSAGIYDLAAELERRSDAVGAQWVISPYADAAQIVLERLQGETRKAADEFLSRLLKDVGLAG